MAHQGQESAAETPERPLEMQVIDIFSRAREILEQYPKTASNQHAEALTKAISRLSAQELEAIISDVNIPAILLKETVLWADSEADNHVRKLSRQVYIAYQNSKLLEMLGDREITAVALPDHVHHGINHFNGLGTTYSSQPVTGRLQEANIAAGYINIAGYNVHPLSFDGSTAAVTLTIGEVPAD